MKITYTKILGYFSNEVFYNLDELVRNLEQAYSVPMTANCMVPRHEMLALLDDLRNALPVEME